MSGEERLLQDITDPRKEQRDTLGDIYHEVRVALYMYDTGQLTADEYNAKIAEMEKFLDSMKFSPKQIA